jgi:hypothetical protein
MSLDILSAARAGALFTSHLSQYAPVDAAYGTPGRPRG